MKVLILSKTLQPEPEPLQSAVIAIRPPRLPRDADLWLALRRRAFAGATPPAREWTRQDFLREVGGEGSRLRRFVWLAWPIGERGATACGAVSLSPPARTSPAASLHWLMVDPDWRRRGIGCLLLRWAEHYCWDRGWRQMRLETHREWTAAVEFFTNQGFH